MHVPGLKVVAPTTAADAKGLLLSSICDPNPVVFLEHRWLHNSEGHVPEAADFRVALGSAATVREGNDVTIVSMSYMTVEAIRAADFLVGHGIACDVIDLRCLAPLDWATVFESVKRTGKLIVADAGVRTGGAGAEIVSHVTESLMRHLSAPPRRVSLPDYPTPTSHAMTQEFYRGTKELVSVVGELLGSDVQYDLLPDARAVPHDVAGEWFKGPF
jgi:pyruvate dehydrogenase E1 component beta subunit